MAHGSCVMDIAMGVAACAWRMGMGRTRDRFSFGRITYITLAGHTDLPGPEARSPRARAHRYVSTAPAEPHRLVILLRPFLPPSRLLRRHRLRADVDLGEPIALDQSLPRLDRVLPRGLRASDLASNLVGHLNRREGLLSVSLSTQRAVQRRGRQLRPLLDCPLRRGRGSQKEVIHPICVLHRSRRRR